jgi:hypothetical protein
MVAKPDLLGSLILVAVSVTVTGEFPPIPAGAR